jgi:protein-S-isoprenylcysteine O-methyltransferase Ste14
VYSNWLIFVLNTVVFIPMMIYRAKQEEKMLKERFVDYTKYKEKV